MVFFFPKTIEIRHSSINGQISVVKLFGAYSLTAGGCTQSGGLVRSIWEKALQWIKRHKKMDAKSIAILGLGAGSAATVAHRLWQNASITGIELDQVMIELGTKYFGLGKIPHLKIVKSDAIHWVFQQKRRVRNRFDLIIIDLYIGSQVTRESRQDNFLESVKNLLTTQGVVLVNHLIKKEGEGKTDNLKEKLARVFSHVERIPTLVNAIFAGWNIKQK